MSYSIRVFEVLRHIYIIVLMMLPYGSVLYAAEYKVAVRAHQGVNEAQKKWQSTLEKIHKELPEHQFTLVPIINLTEISQRVRDGDVDFVLTNPSSYVEIEQLYNARVLVTLNNKRASTPQSQFGSVIITHASNEAIFTIKDLKGKRFMAVSKLAFGGWNVALMEMIEQGFDPYRELKDLIFTKSNTQQEIVMAVMKGKVDAGVVRTDMLERLENEGKIDMRYFRIINNKDVKGFPFFLSTKLYPEWAFARMAHIPDELAEKITGILLSIRINDQAAISGKYVGWIKPDSYKSVKQLMKRLKLRPYTHK